MEWVRGESITDYCAKAQLDRKQRLELFTAVCRAVQHAHQKGVIHRDLKPSNILVCEEEGTAVPRVIDFGIARAVEPEEGQVALTREHQSLGTPEYMAPEQMVGDPGKSIDTRVDVWSLGVLFYELLTGSRPFEWEAESHGIDTFFEVVRSEECDRPSTRSTKRPSPPVRVSPAELAGDLDWICLKALRKDPAERYATALGFAEDIERHLADEPVLARPPSQVIAMTKWVRRHRGAVAALGAITLLLIGGLIALAIALGQKEAALTRAMDQERRTSLAEAATRRELELATELGQVLRRMLSSVNPEEARGGDVALLRSILDDTATRLENGEIENPRVAAEVHFVIGSTYRGLALYERAQSHLERALELHITEFGTEHAETQEVRSTLAFLYFQQDSFDDALVLATEVSAIYGRTIGVRDAKAISARSIIAKILWSRGELKEALRIQRECLEQLQAIKSESDEDVLDARHSLGLLLVDLAQWEEAEHHLREASKWRAETLGDDHPSTLKSTSAVADLLHSTGRAEEAEGILRASLEQTVRVMGPDSPLALGLRRNLADALMTLERFDEALEAYEVVLAHQRRLSDRDAGMARTLNNLGILHAKAGRMDDAEGMYREALEIKIEVLGPDHQSSLGSQANLGGLLYNLGKDREAVELLEPAVERLDRVLGPSHPWSRAARQGLEAALEAIEFEERGR